MYSITIIFPVLNERLRLQKGIDSIEKYLKSKIENPVNILIMDNGSTDETPEIGIKLENEYSNVKYIQLQERGVGVAFREGIKRNQSDIVGYMDIDLSCGVDAFGQMIECFQEDEGLDYVNGTRFARNAKTKGRKWYRQVTSYGLIACLKAFFHMKVSDALAGFTFVKKEKAENLIRKCSDDNGWFYTVEFVLRAERLNYKVYDLPLNWEEDYNTTVKVWKTIRNYIVQMMRLYKELEGEKRNAKEDRLS